MIGAANISPTGPPSKAMPRAPALRPKSSCTAGMRATQFARATPCMKNVAATASRAVRSRTPCSGALSAVPLTNIPSGTIPKCQGGSMAHEMMFV